MCIDVNANAIVAYVFRVDHFMHTRSRRVRKNRQCADQSITTTVTSNSNQEIYFIGEKNFSPPPLFPLSEGDEEENGCYSNSFVKITTLSHKSSLVTVMIVTKSLQK